MKYILIFILTVLMFPVTAFAKEPISISCEKNNIKNNEEIECRIYVKENKNIITSISGNVTTSKNLVITNSNYDKNMWKILDDKFNVKSINLISENKKLVSEFDICTFRIKAINKESTKEYIKFENILFGDDNYEEKHLETIEIYINTHYDYENISNYSFILYIVIGITVLMLHRFRLKNKQ